MSRVGKNEIILPEGVAVEKSNTLVNIKGPMGALQISLMDGTDISIDGNKMNVTVTDDKPYSLMAGFHGLYRALLNNMVVGVSQGFVKELEIVGVGYRATQQGNSVQFQLGYSHNIVFDPPEGITVEVLEPTKLIVKGIDKQAVGQVAADIRKLRPPEPYKGKGIKYKNEIIRKKAGKTGK